MKAIKIVALATIIFSVCVVLGIPASDADPEYIDAGSQTFSYDGTNPVVKDFTIAVGNVTVKSAGATLTFDTSGLSISGSSPWSLSPKINDYDDEAKKAAATWKSETQGALTLTLRATLSDNNTHVILFDFKVNNTADGEVHYYYKYTFVAEADQPTVFLHWNHDDYTDGDYDLTSDHKLYPLPTPEPAREGYSGVEWHISSALTDDALEEGADLTGVEDIYADWVPITYTIAFSGGTGASGSMDPMAMIYDVSQNLSANEFTKTGYVFKDWTDGSKTYDDEESVKNLSSTQGATVTLTAVWTPITYTISFAGGEGASGSMDPMAMTYDAPQNLSANEFTKTGYVFKDWKYGSDTYADKASVSNLSSTQDANVVLTAEWTPITYTIAFSGGTGSSGLMESMAMTYDAAQNLTANAFTKTGYVFKDWTNGTKTYADGASVKNLSSTQGATVTLTAEWTPITYTIAFAGGAGSSGSTSSMAMTYDVSQNLTANGFTKTGYHFKDWTDGSKTYADGESVKNLSSTQGATVTLTAEWTANTYQVKFLSGGGSGSMTNQSFTYDEAEKALKANTFTKTGYHFKNWSGNSTTYADKQKVQNLSTEDGAVIELTAVWQPITYKVRFAAGTGGSGSMDDQTLTYGTSVALSENGFTRTGYTFNGWKGSDGKSYTDKQSVLNLASVQDAVFTMTAQWTPVKYDQTFEISATTPYGTLSGTSLTSVSYDSVVRVSGNSITMNGKTITVTPNADDPTTKKRFAVDKWQIDGQDVVSGTTKISGSHTFTLIMKQVDLYTITWSIDGTDEYELYALNELPTHEDPVKPPTETTEYIFVGWDPEIVKVTGEATYTAVFEEVTTYYITWHGNGGSPDTYVEERDHAGELGQLRDVSRTGYNFLGWYTDQTGGTKVTTGTLVRNNMDIWAHWSLIVDPDVPSPLPPDEHKESKDSEGNIIIEDTTSVINDDGSITYTETTRKVNADGSEESHSVQTTDGDGYKQKIVIDTVKDGDGNTTSTSTTETVTGGTTKVIETEKTVAADGESYSRTTTTSVTGTVTTYDSEITYQDASGRTTSIALSGNDRDVDVEISGFQPEDIEVLKDVLEDIEQDANILCKGDGTVTIPASAVSQLASSDVTLEVSGSEGSLTVDNRVLRSSAQKGGDLKLEIVRADDTNMNVPQIETVGDLYAVVVTMTLNGQVVHDIGGTAMIDIAPGYTATYVYYVDDSGSPSLIESSYDSETGQVIFVVDHFSLYMVSAVKVNEKNGNATMCIAIAAVIIVLIAVIAFVLYRRRNASGN